MKKKLVTVEEAVKCIHDGTTLMVGGFLACGTSEIMMDAIIESGVKDLTVIGNDTGYENVGIGKLICEKRVKKAICSHIGTNKETGRQITAGELEVTLTPQGTLAEVIRAGGTGLGGVITPTGLGTEVAEGKQTITLNGIEYLIELPIHADVAILKGTIVDKAGNVFYDATTKNFQTVMAYAADTVIVEAEKLVEVGELDPNLVMTPAALVNYIIVGGDK
ncbi:MAG: 3-oxoacid CoA-transferase subunit A [Lachnospiraceae bacterium]